MIFFSRPSRSSLASRSSRRILNTLVFGGLPCAALVLVACMIAVTYEIGRHETTSSSSQPFA